MLIGYVSFVTSLEDTAERIRLSIRVKLLVLLRLPLDVLVLLGLQRLPQLPRSAYLSRRKGGLALPQHAALAAPVENADRLEREAWSNFHQARGTACSCRPAIHDDLVVAEPNVAVEIKEAQNMIDKRLREWMVPRGVEIHLQERLDYSKMRQRFELFVEVQQRPAVLEAVSNHAQLIGSVHIPNLKLDARAIWGLPEPQKGYVMSMGLKEEDGVAMMQRADFNKVVANVVRRSNLGVFPAVRHEVTEIYEQVAVLAGDVARAENEALLLVCGNLFRCGAAKGHITYHVVGIYRYSWGWC